MKTPETPGFGAAQKEKLAEVLAEIRKFHFPVSIDDIGEQYVFALTVRDLVIRLQTLATPVLPVETMVLLNSIEVDVQDFVSASGARAELDALVPAVKDALASLDSPPDALLPGSLTQLLRDRELNAVSKEVERALLATESDPPVAITAARAALESLLKGYIEDRGACQAESPENGQSTQDRHG